MSEELKKKIDELTAENDQQKKTISQSQAAIDGLTSQVDAYREQLNETLTLGMTLRTNVIHIKRQYQNLSQEHDNLKKAFNGVNKQLEDATSRIGEIESH